MQNGVALVSKNGENNYNIHESSIFGAK